MSLSRSSSRNVSPVNLLFAIEAYRLLRENEIIIIRSLQILFPNLYVVRGERSSAVRKENLYSGVFDLLRIYMNPRV